MKNKDSELDYTNLIYKNEEIESAGEKIYNCICTGIVIILMCLIFSILYKCCKRSDYSEEVTVENAES